TFWNFAHEFSSFQAARGGHFRAALSPDTPLSFHSADRVGCLSAHSPSRRARAQERGGRLSAVMRPRWTGTSRRPPIGWLPCGLGVRRPRVPPGLREPRRLDRSTSRQAFVRETPNATGPCCVRGRKTPPAGGSWRRYRASGETATDVFMKRLVKLPTI